MFAPTATLPAAFFIDGSGNLAIKAGAASSTTSQAEADANATALLSEEFDSLIESEQAKCASCDATANCGQNTMDVVYLSTLDKLKWMQNQGVPFPGCTPAIVTGPTVSSCNGGGFLDSGVDHNDFPSQPNYPGTICNDFSTDKIVTVTITGQPTADICFNGDCQVAATRSITLLACGGTLTIETFNDIGSYTVAVTVTDP